LIYPADEVMFEDGSILNDLFLERLNYFIYVVLLLIGLHAMISKNNFIKKLIGMCVFQTAIILFYVSIGVKDGATIASYANPLPHVLMLTAIVVGVATLGLALALCQKIYEGYGTVEEDELMAKLEKEDAVHRKPPTRTAVKSTSKPKASSRAKSTAQGPAGKTIASKSTKSSGARKTKAPSKKAPVKKTPVKKTVRKSTPKKGDSK